MTPEEMGKSFYRNTLNEQGKHFYDEMLAHFSESQAGEVSLTLFDRDCSSKDAFAAGEALRNDRPELFFLGTRQWFYSEEKTKGILKYEILYSEEEFQMIRFHAKRVLRHILNDTQRMSLLHRECLIYERVADVAVYLDREEPHDHNIVAPILRRSGVCEGINALLLLALRMAGIPCIKVIGCGKKSGGGQAWAMAWPDGRTPVHLDATWENHRKGEPSFRHFNLSDRQISEDHDAFAREYLPRCQKEFLNYDKICRMPLR